MSAKHCEARLERIRAIPLDGAAQLLLSYRRDDDIHVPANASSRTAWTPPKSIGSSRTARKTVPAAGNVQSAVLFSIHHARRGNMQKGFREKSYGDRLGEAARAKQAQLERARAKSPANDPEFAARQESRRLTGLAREVRQEERRQAKLAALEREAAERIAADAARAIALKAEAAAREVELAERARREKEREVEQKAARDIRYAARKARRK
jgi:hypothetical protein